MDKTGVNYNDWFDKIKLRLVLTKYQMDFEDLEYFWSKVLKITAITIIPPPKKTLVGGISFINNQTQSGAQRVSDSINKPTVTDWVVLDPIVIQIKPKVSWGTPNKKPIKISWFVKFRDSAIINP